MGRGDGFTTKGQSNAMKAKGLGRLRWFCQVCEKQMRDENGFQAHCRSEPHLRKIIAVGPNAGATIAEFSRQFQYEFLQLLRTRHNTQRVRANAVYNEYIQDKDHVHMNATRWVTLSGFVGTLGKAGIVKVDEDENGQLWIQWIDTRPETLAKHAAQQKKERSTMDGEERERKMIEDQIARARAAVGAEETPKALERPEGEKIKLSLSLAPPKNEAAESLEESKAETNPTTLSGTESTPGNKISFGTIGTGAKVPIVNPLKAAGSNPLKRAAPGNVFKSAKVAKTDDEPKGKAFMSEAERLMKEDLSRKANRGGYQGAGPRRGDARRY